MCWVHIMYFFFSTSGHCDVTESSETKVWKAWCKAKMLWGKKNHLSFWRKIDVSEKTGKNENNISNCDFSKESSKATWLNYANHLINLNGREIVILKIQRVRHQEKPQFSCLFEGHWSDGIIIKVSPYFRSIQMPRWRWLALTATGDNEAALKLVMQKSHRGE